MACKSPDSVEFSLVGIVGYQHLVDADDPVETEAVIHLVPIVEQEIGQEDDHKQDDQDGDGHVFV